MVPKLFARKILAVDDNPVILKALSLVLEARGYEVFTALDGPEAFSIARQENLDLILLDIIFPPDITQTGNTWDAFLIIDWIQRISVAEGVPIIIISGAEPEKFRDRCLAMGAAAFLTKPLEVPKLMETIREVFSRQEANARPKPVTNFTLKLAAPIA
jgi:two-component system KDP operon response regulator KdpE